MLIFGDAVSLASSLLIHSTNFLTMVAFVFLGVRLLAE